MGCPFPQGTGRYLEIRVRRGGGFVRLSKLGHKTHLYLAFCHVKWFNTLKLKAAMEQVVATEGCARRRADTKPGLPSASWQAVSLSAPSFHMQPTTGGKEKTNGKHGAPSIWGQPEPVYYSCVPSFIISEQTHLCRAGVQWTWGRPGLGAWCVGQPVGTSGRTCPFWCCGDC